MVVHLFLNNNKALDFLPINSIKNGGITDLMDLLSIDDRSLICLVSENSQHSSNYYGSDTSAEVEKMQLMLDHKEQLLIQKEREIEALKLALSAFQKA